MSVLEQIVRPFARPDTLARRRIVASNTKVDVPEAIISWGRSGTLPGAQEIEQIDPTGVKWEVITCDDDYDETERETYTERVYERDAQGHRVPSGAFIDVKRISTIGFKKNKPKRKTYTVHTSTDTLGNIYKVLQDNDNKKKCKTKYKLKPEEPQAA